MDTICRTVRAVLAEVLGLDAARAAALSRETKLFGALPELDSLAVANLLAELEERLGIRVEDDEVEPAMLATVGALTDYAHRKTAE